MLCHASRLAFRKVAFDPSSFPLGTSAYLHMCNDLDSASMQLCLCLQCALVLSPDSPSSVYTSLYRCQKASPLLLSVLLNQQYLINFEVASPKHASSFRASTRELHELVQRSCSISHTWLWVKNMYPKWNPGKWKHGLKPAVPWWCNFDADPHQGV